MKLSGPLAEKGLKIFDGEMRYHAGHEVTRLWIVVADQEKAKIFRKVIAEGIELIATASAGSDEKDVRLPNESYGRMHVQQLGKARHSMDPHKDKARKGPLKFVHKLATWLEEAEGEDAFDRLVLIAAPKTLGELRPLLSDRVYNRVITELDKDLASMSDAQIREHLDTIVWF